MCVKGSRCRYPCTPCLVDRENACAAAWALASSRVVNDTGTSHVGNATIGTLRGAASRRADVELDHTLNSVVPARETSDCFRNGPRMLYRFSGVDRLHVSSFCLRALSCSSSSYDCVGIGGDLVNGLSYSSRSVFMLLLIWCTWHAVHPSTQVL